MPLFSLTVLFLLSIRSITCCRNIPMSRYLLSRLKSVHLASLSFFHSPPAQHGSKNRRLQELSFWQWFVFWYSTQMWVVLVLTATRQQTNVTAYLWQSRVSSTMSGSTHAKRFILWTFFAGSLLLVIYPAIFSFMDNDTARQSHTCKSLHQMQYVMDDSGDWQARRSHNFFAFDWVMRADNNFAENLKVHDEYLCVDADDRS